MRSIHRSNEEEVHGSMFALNVLVSAVVISFASWLSGRLPTLAGFVVAMPIASMLVLPLSYLEHGSTASSVLLAKSILLAIPVSLCFFVPFFLSERWALSFWQAYALGCGALVVGFGIHRALARTFFV